MSNNNFLYSAITACLVASSNVAAVPFVVDYGININGTNVLISDGIGFQSGVVDGLDPDGFGSISLSFSASGAYEVDAFFDYEFDEFGSSFFNESGSADGTPTTGQSWEIDEPEFVFGDIFTNWQNNDLDNFNNVPAGLEDDVSVALGWDFNLAANEIAQLVFRVSANAPLNGFYLTHFDQDEDDAAYFSSSLTITQAPPNPNVIPEPGTMGMLLLGLSGLLARKNLMS